MEKTVKATHTPAPDLLNQCRAADSALVLMIGFAAAVGQDEQSEQSADDLVLLGIEVSKAIRAAISRAEGGTP